MSAPVILFAGGARNWPRYHQHLETALTEAGITARLVTTAAPETVDYIIYAPDSGLQDFAPFTRCKAVLSLWAGVERITGLASLTQPLCRMVDPSLARGMTEWVAGHVLRHHLGMDRHIVNPDHEWHPVAPPLASERPVTILGMGELGQAAARALRALGFPVSGWSRRPRTVAGVNMHHGPDGLRDAMAVAQILVTLLPATPATGNLLDARRLAWLPQGAVILNPGRGQVIDDAALLAALDSGQIGQATLDVFRVEPLPADHPYWRHPRVTVTPHIAAETRPATSARVIVENIRRGEAGEPFLHLVDRAHGY